MESASGSRTVPLDPAAILASGRRTVAFEAEALWSLARHLDDRFVEAVLLLRATEGRVVACGLGKSGHVARKLAATLMATGTPASFLHAGEAAHGDLGQLARGDTLLVLSNSGDTREHGVILRRAAALAIPVVAITAQRGSPVAAAARVCLLLPTKPEACPFGSTPTTSAAMMMALGDALALAVLRQRGLGAADLLTLHPGGRLGIDLLPVTGFMRRDDLPLVTETLGSADLVDTVTRHGLGVAGVVDEAGRLVGIVTDGDIRRHARDLAGATAAAIMTRRPRTLGTACFARDALAIMAQARITSLFVIDEDAGGRVAGLIHLHDVLRLGVA